MVRIFFSTVLPRSFNEFPDAVNSSGRIDEFNVRATRLNAELLKLEGVHVIDHPDFGRHRYDVQRHLLSRDGLHLSPSGLSFLREDLIAAVDHDRIQRRPAAATPTEEAPEERFTVPPLSSVEDFPPLPIAETHTLTSTHTYFTTITPAAQHALSTQPASLKPTEPHTHHVIDFSRTKNTTHRPKVAKSVYMPTHSRISRTSRRTHTTPQQYHVVANSIPMENRFAILETLYVNERDAIISKNDLKPSFTARNNTGGRKQGRRKKPASDQQKVKHIVNNSKTLDVDINEPLEVKHDVNFEPLASKNVVCNSKTTSNVVNETTQVTSKRMVGGGVFSVGNTYPSYDDFLLHFDQWKSETFSPMKVHDSKKDIKNQEIPYKSHLFQHWIPVHRAILLKN